MLYILFANLLGCHSVLLMHFVHPLYTFLKIPTPNLFTVHACLRVSHQLILLICGRRSRKGCLHRVCWFLLGQWAGYCARITEFFMIHAVVVLFVHFTTRYSVFHKLLLTWFISVTLFLFESRLTM